MIDLIIVAAYFLLMLIFGWSNRHQTAESYWVAGRTHSASRISLSLVATIFGASSTMGIIGLGYSRGFTGAWWSLIGGIALIPFALLLASRVRSLSVYTLPDILRKAYGDRVALPAGLMISIAWCGVIAAQIIAGGKLVSVLFPVSLDIALIIVSIVFILYTFWGGQLSVIKTDTWQFPLFLFGLFIVLIFLLVSGSATHDFWSAVPAAHWRFPVSDLFGWYDMLVFYPLIVGFPYLVGPDIYSRVFCAKDDQAARKGALTAAMIVIPISFLLAFAGIMAKAKFPEIPAEAALPTILTSLIPVGLKGIIIIGFLGAIMSSADTCLLSAATILSLNVIKLPAGSKEQQLKITKILIIVLGVTAWFIASQQRGIISSLLLGYTVFVGGVVCPTLASFFKDRLRITQWGALCSVIIGGLSAVFGKIQGGAVMKTILTDHGQALFEMILGPKYLSILPVILSIIALLIISWLLPEKNR